MTTDMREQLERLAGEATPARAPADLWRRGVRRRRRIRAASALATVTAVLVAMLGSAVAWDQLRADEPTPTGNAAVAALPDRLVTPDIWLPGTADAGPIGPLAVVAGAERAAGWFGTENGTVAVSATTGEYRFLDLPGRAEDGTALSVDQPWALSPDGRIVSYWIGQPGHPDRVGGYAAYDTVTGEVTRHPVRTELGLSPLTMEWVSADTVLLAYGVVTELRADSATGRHVRDRFWAPGPDRLTPVDLGDPGVGNVSPVPGGFAAPLAHGLAVYDVPSGDRGPVLRYPAGLNPQQVTVDPSGRRAAALPEITGGNGFSTRRLLVGALGQGRADLRPLRVEVDVFDLLGWTDSRHLVVRGSVGQRVAAYAVDVRTGDHRVLVAEERERWGEFPQYAGSLLARPPVARPAPDDVTDPRLLALGAGTAALALAGGLLLVRRRRARV
ncbi:hypothetical protein [Nocardioides mesophilus]|uniref:Uncharacterized protein n=1 Tax=Nocardioides mesophilus TaxID=433659 RepID=A0A7G9RBI0_9ACTN|nr:hypothetical protein [Nocardioides mesophilus]QNN52955.1 hypothetical protein H9L09_00055 [Nocardioides mesophilus]